MNFTPSQWERNRMLKFCTRLKMLVKLSKGVEASSVLLSVRFFCTTHLVFIRKAPFTWRLLYKGHPVKIGISRAPPYPRVNHYLGISGNQKSRTPKPEITLKNGKSRTLNVEVITPRLFRYLIFRTLNEPKHWQGAHSNKNRKNPWRDFQHEDFELYLQIRSLIAQLPYR